METISVIVPVYKVEPYLHRCVDSVLAQTYQNFEIILVDDGSPDNCGAICDEYAARDARIRVIHKENGGLSSARNAGLAVAQGEYIYFLDSDDYIDPELLAHALAGIQGYDMVSFDYRSVDENGNVLRHYSYQHGPIVWRDEQEKFQFFLQVFFPRRTWGVFLRLYRKSIIDKYGLFFEDNNRIFAEDLYFTFLYLLHCRAINCLDAEHYNYLKRSDSIMGVQVKRHNLGRMIELIKAVERHLDAQSGFPYIKEHFPIVFGEVFRIALKPSRKIVGKNNIRELRTVVCSDIQDLSYFCTMTSALLRCGDTLRYRYGYIRAGEILSEYRYFLDGNYAGYMIRRCWFGALKRLSRIAVLRRRRASA